MYEYSDEQHHVTYTYVTTMHKGTDAYWIIQFVVTPDKAADYLQEMLEAAKAVRFK